MIAAKLNDLEVRRHAGSFVPFVPHSSSGPVAANCVYGQLSTDELLLGASVALGLGPFLPSFLLSRTIGGTRVYSGTFPRGSLFSGCGSPNPGGDFLDGAQRLGARSEARRSLAEESSSPIYQGRSSRSFFVRWLRGRVTVGSATMQRDEIRSSNNQPTSMHSSIPISRWQEIALSLNDRWSCN